MPGKLFALVALVLVLGLARPTSVVAQTEAGTPAEPTEPPAAAEPAAGEPTTVEPTTPDPGLPPVPRYELEADIYLPGRATALWAMGSLFLAGSISMVAWGNGQRSQRDDALADCLDPGLLCSPGNELDRATIARYAALGSGLMSVALLTAAILKTVRRRRAQRRLRDRAIQEGRASFDLDLRLAAGEARFG
ncbi:MAG: hypothetical protein AAGH15_08270, partial [Myxococcota bacterium]